MRTVASLLAGLAIAFVLGALDVAWLQGMPLVIVARPIAMLLSLVSGVPLEQEASMVLVLAAMPITLFVIGVGIGVGIDALLSRD